MSFGHSLRSGKIKTTIRDKKEERACRPRSPGARATSIITTTQGMLTGRRYHEPPHHLSRQRAFKWVRLTVSVL